MAAVTLENVSLFYGHQAALRELSLAVAAGQYVVVLGASASGKSSLLRVIAGLVSAQAGKVMFSDVDVTRLAPRKRNVALVPQAGGLYPHLTIEKNIHVAMRGRVPKSKRAQQLQLALDRVGLLEQRNRLPSQLSGGQQRRAALARAIAAEPGVLLLDEPLSALDAGLRLPLERDLAELHRRRRDAVDGPFGGVTLHVTHDGQEAMRLADQIIVLDRGQSVQSGAPTDVASRPATASVAAALGESMFIQLNVQRSEGRWHDERGNAVSKIWAEHLKRLPKKTEHACLGYYQHQSRSGTDADVEAGRDWYDAINHNIVRVQDTHIFARGLRQ